jgi:hemerythrin-like domain-containing protein
MRPSSSSARKTERFPLFDTPAGFDDPLGMLLGCHRRIEKKLATLTSLAAHLAAKGIDAQASVAAQAVLRYFNVAAAHHHADEEEDLFPMLGRRIGDAPERERFAQLDASLRKEHREMEDLWARLRRPLEGIAEGLMRTLPQADVQAFVALYRRHIKAEEAVLQAAVARWLTEHDLKLLGHAMAERRGADFPV